jgi:hypothetical protein
MEWEKRAGKRSWRGVEPSQKAQVEPSPTDTLVASRKVCSPATIAFQMGVSRK